MSLSLTDLFCGLGGSTTGALDVPGITVQWAANHWELAVDSHNANHPDTKHLLSDISQTDPRYISTTDLLWASPECTNHSRAKGRKKIYQPDMFGDNLPDEAAERSRATMWDVVRFTEVHRYKAIIVENVVEVLDWAPDGAPVGCLFESWLLTLRSMGYKHRIVSLNSMHAQGHGLPAPQSRDRVYVCLWLSGNPAPDFERMLRPKAYCPTCDELVDAMQAWKRPDARAGRYRSQYVYRCPRVSCRNQIVEPAWLPALSFIDLTNLGQRIGDRDRPLAHKTMLRLEHGRDKFWLPLLLETANGYDAADPRHPRHLDPDSYWRAWPLTEPVRTMHTRESKGLALHPLMVPAGGTWNDAASSSIEVARTRTTRESEGLAFAPMLIPVEGRDGKQSQSAAQAARTMTTRNETGVALPPFVAELRGGGSKARLASDPLATVTASGNHHALVMPYYGNGQVQPAERPLPTVTTVDRHAVMQNPSIDLNDVHFRMLEPSEIKQAMAFPADYLVLGNRREQVKLAGNAVTPCSARDLVAAVAESLGVAA